jgi:hypothetical protein
MDRKHLYHVYTKHERSAYFLPQVEPRLRVYIHKRIPDNSSQSQVLEQVQELVKEVKELQIAEQDCTPEPENQKEWIKRKRDNQKGSITALLGYILFVKKRVRLDKYLINLQRYFPEADFDDICQISLIVISRPTKFLKNFSAEPDEPNWFESLCQYSDNKFQTFVTDEIRRIVGDKGERTNLGVLNRTSPSKVETIVGEQFKKDGEYFNQLVLLHQCFQELVKTEDNATKEPKSDRKVKEFITNHPKPEHYDALLARYRERKTEQDRDIADRAEVTKLLEDLGNSVRNYFQPTGGARSLDEPLGEDDTSVTLVEMQEAPVTIISPEQELALELLRQNSPSCVDGSLKFGIAKKPDRKLEKIRLADLTFFLLDGLGLTQIEAGRELNRGFTVLGKRRTKAILTIAKEFYFRYENQTPTKDISAETLDPYKNYIEPIFEDYYAEMAIDLLAEVTASTTESSIVDVFIQCIEARWQFEFKPDGEGLSKVYAFVQRQQTMGKWGDGDKIHKSLRLNKAE